MKITKILSILLVSTSFAAGVSHACEKEEGNNKYNALLYAHSKGAQMIHPERTYIQDLSHNVATDVTSDVANHLWNLYQICKIMYNRGGDNVVGELSQELIYHVNGQLISRFLKNRDVSADFDPESVAPFVEETRQHMSNLIQWAFAKQYAWNRKTGEKYWVYDEAASPSLFTLIAENIIPDSVPLKGLFASIMNLDPVNNYLMKKVDQQIVRSFLSLYQWIRSESLKNDTQQALKQLGDFAVSGVQYLAADYEDCKNLPSLVDDNAYAPFWEYLSPHLNSYIREAFQQVLSGIKTTAMETGHILAWNGLKKTLESPYIISSVSNGISLVGGGITYGIGGGWFGGLLIGGGAFTVGPTVVSSTFKSILNTTQSRIDRELALMIEYHSYNFVPLTPNEHYLYHLNPEPTQEEKAIYHWDYARREYLQNNNTFMAAIIKQVIGAENGAELLKLLPKLGTYVQTFVNYCWNNPDVTAEMILSQMKKDNVSSGVGAYEESEEAVNSERQLREFIQRVLNENPQHLSPEGRKLKMNLIDQYPSYQVMKIYLEELSRYQNYLSKNDQENARLTFEKMKATSEELVRHIQYVHQAIEEAANHILDIAEDCGCDMTALGEEKIVETINASATKLTPAQQDLLAEALDDDAFLKTYLKERSDNLKEHFSTTETSSNFLKEILVEFSKKKYEGFIKEFFDEDKANESVFEAVKASSLSEGLEDHDIIHLLKGLTPEQRQEEIFDKLTTLLSLEAIQAHETKLIKDKVETLLSRHVLITKYANHFEADFSEIIQGMCEEIYKVDSQLSVENAVEEIFIILAKNEKFKSLRQTLKTDKSITERDRRDFYGEIKLIVKESYQRMVGGDKQLEEDWVLPSKDTEESTEAKGEPTVARNVPVTRLKLYEYEIASTKVAQVVNEFVKKGAFEGRPLNELKDHDFELIMTELQKTSMGELNSSMLLDDIEFQSNYFNEMMSFKINSPLFKDKILYTYSEIIEEMRKQNQQILELVRNLKK